jgi:arylsulfatase A-like enzyme
LDENTLVIFTADQGLAAGQSGFWGMGDHTRPLTAYDWTIHTPLIFWYPDHIRAGTRSDLLVSNYDFLPTVLEYLGLKERAPKQPPLPGHSFAAALAGKRAQPNEAVYFEFENTRAVRTKDWKYIHRFPDGPDELYDLKADPDERQNLAGRPAQAKVRRDLSGRLKEFFDRYADPKYDLSRGGKSKAKRRTK